ncbi:MAG: hypothetical protein OEV28_00730 [Nitrospirota bacterium]|nr:hypothetical protein [Nitrospirota bacterium]
MGFNFDTIESILGILFFGYIIYFVIFRAPASDMVFSAGTDTEIEDMKDYLEMNGIKTYKKNIARNRKYTKSGPLDPSLHVINLHDKARALQLIKERAS